MRAIQSLQDERPILACFRRKIVATQTLNAWDSNQNAIGNIVTSKLANWSLQSAAYALAPLACWNCSGRFILLTLFSLWLQFLLRFFMCLLHSAEMYLYLGFVPCEHFASQDSVVCTHQGNPWKSSIEKSMSKPRISEYFAHSSGRAAFSASSSSASFKANTTINATVNTARTGLKEAMTAAPAHMITKPV